MPFIKPPIDEATLIDFDTMLLSYLHLAAKSVLKLARLVKYEQEEEFEKLSTAGIAEWITFIHPILDEHQTEFDNLLNAYKNSENGNATPKEIRRCPPFCKLVTSIYNQIRQTYRTLLKDLPHLVFAVNDPNRMVGGDKDNKAKDTSIDVLTYNKKHRGHKHLLNDDKGDEKIVRAEGYIGWEFKSKKDIANRPNGPIYQTAADAVSALCSAPEPSPASPVEDTTSATSPPAVVSRSQTGVTARVSQRRPTKGSRKRTPT